MIPWRELPQNLVGEELVLRYLREPDHPWLRALIESYERFEGRPRRELNTFLQVPLGVAAPPGRQRAARRVLDRLWPAAEVAALPPTRARAALFRAAAGESAGQRSSILRRVARQQGVSPRALEAALFADLPGERRLGQRPPELEAGELALRVNLAMAQGVLGRARSVRLDLAGGARALVRVARYVGLICTVYPPARPRSAADFETHARLELSGPLALFRRTRLYARGLAALVPRLSWCARFALEADCEGAQGSARFCLSSGDPIFPAAPPPPWDSRLEERFARDFQRAAPDWDLLREPAPVQAGEALVFPDFLIQHRRQRWRRWLLEIVGFWTPDYVRHKLASLRAAGRSDLILAIDEDRRCSEADLPRGAPLIRFRRRVPPDAVLAIIDRPPGKT